MVDGRSHRRTARFAAVIAVIGLLAVGLSSTAGAAKKDLLGTKNPATGTPVKIGFISNGKTATVDQSIETPVAQATVKWINEYSNGIGGHPIELDICTDRGEPSGATDCGNQMIQDKVAAVIVAQNSQNQAIFDTVHTSGIPLYYYGASNPSIVADTTSTFVLLSGDATLLGLSVGVAKDTKQKKVTAVAIDVPAATSFFKGPGPALYQKEGLTLDLVPVAAGTADMTPQMQQVVSNNPKGVVFIIGNDAFCIAALNGLRTAGFKGSVTTIPQCLTDATRTAVPADFLEGISISATNPIGNPKDPTIKQYFAVLDKYGATSVDKSNLGGAAAFTAFGGFDVANRGAEG